MDIQLTQGLITVIDDIDSDLASFSWCSGKNRNTFYAIRRILKSDGSATTERLHQVVARRMGIAGLPDHIDRNGLNNRRDNLRPATRGQNGVNVGLRPDNASGFKGVSVHKASGKWQAGIRVDGKRSHLGLYGSPAEAAAAYDRAALKHFGLFADLNFPGAS